MDSLGFKEYRLYWSSWPVVMHEKVFVRNVRLMSKKLNFDQPWCTIGLAPHNHPSIKNTAFSMLGSIQLQKKVAVAYAATCLMPRVKFHLFNKKAASFSLVSRQILASFSPVSRQFLASFSPPSRHSPPGAPVSRQFLATQPPQSARSASFSQPSRKPPRPQK